MTIEQQESIKQRREQLEANKKSLTAMYEMQRKELDEKLSDLRLQCDHTDENGKVKFTCKFCGGMSISATVKNKMAGPAAVTTGLDNAVKYQERDYVVFADHHLKMNQPPKGFFTWENPWASVGEIEKKESK